MSNEPYLCRLYLISPPTLVPHVFAQTLDAALGAGDVGAFQLRLKNASDDDIRAATRALLPVTYRHDVAFIINDRVDLVNELAVDGVHLGQDDMAYAEARAQLGPDAVIGVSCHDSTHMAMEAGEAGADYVAFGAFYATKSKSAEKLAKYGTPTKDILENWSAVTTVPAVAIGGLTPENCGALVTAGADFIAAITAVWEHPNGAAAAVVAFNQAIKNGLSARVA
jgi:thiamine-phosphate pyrophosphorylase